MVSIEYIISIIKVLLSERVKKVIIVLPGIRAIIILVKKHWKNTHTIIILIINTYMASCATWYN